MATSVTSARIHPSGEQAELRRGDQRAVVTEVGGGLRLYEVGGWSVLDGYRADESCSGGRGQLLLPWPNRIRDGRYSFGGIPQQLALTEPARGNAIHGLVRWSSWLLRQPDLRRVTASHRLYPQPGYPFTIDFQVDYELLEAGLRVQISATNVGSTPTPYGAGQHPYLTFGTPLIDAALLQLRAETMVPSDARGLPIGGPAPVAGDHDFRQPRPIGDVHLDSCYGDVARDPSGRAHVLLSNPDDGRAIDLWMDGSFQYLMVFTGDTLEPARRRRSIAIEPMTCPPDAFNSEGGLLVLEPGQTTQSAWGITSTLGHA
jgi:aldose 1-epimerase